MTLRFRQAFHRQGFWPCVTAFIVAVFILSGCKSPDEQAREIIEQHTPKEIILPGTGPAAGKKRVYAPSGRPPKFGGKGKGADQNKGQEKGQQKGKSKGDASAQILGPLMRPGRLVAGEVFTNPGKQTGIRWAAFYLDSADRAFGVATGLTRPNPRMAFEKDGLYNFYFRAPFYTGWCGRVSIVAQFPTYQAYLRKEVEDYLTAVCKKLPPVEGSNRLYHYRLLPEFSRVRNSTTYSSSLVETGSGVDLPRVYWADYRFGANRGTVQVSEAGNGAEASRLFKRIQRRLNEQSIPWSLLKSPGIVTADTIYYSLPDVDKEQSYVVIHRYRWLLLVFTGLPEPDRAKPLLGKMYQTMSRIRDDVRRYKKEKKE